MQLSIDTISVETVEVSALTAYSKNPRTHSKKQVRQIAAAIQQFGWTNPILVDTDGCVIAGHGRLEAAKLLKLDRVPVIRIEHMTEAEKRAYILADNKLAENAGWDRDLLGLELLGLLEMDIEFDIQLTGFEMGEIDLLIGGQQDPGLDDVDQIAVPNETAFVSVPGDLWALGPHRLLCADATQCESYHTLLGAERAQLVFTDPPYNVPIRGHVSGLGEVKHDEFAMASGEMSEAEFVGFLKTTLRELEAFSMDGSIHFICMDWRHLFELLTAGRAVYTDLKNLCVWNKTNGGMGSFYRSKHELVAVFKSGTKPHINNIELGVHGRNRTNVWDFAGVNSFGEEREHLTLHPTVKPVALIEEAIKDCSNRNDIVLDAFAGSGSTIMAAERTGRRAFALEIDPKYVDVCLERYLRLTGDDPIHVDSGLFWTELK